MKDTLLSVGIDIGTSTTQLVFSRLHLKNRANAFSVPEIVISEKELIYRGEVSDTPLSSPDRIDAPAIRALVDREYRRAGIDKGDIDTGAVIITGETARKENAAEVLRALSAYAGDFVVATAGPALESVLAARGSGAAQWAERHAGTLIHIDIGGGTSNFAVFSGGKLTDTGCVNVGGRLLRLSKEGVILWRSPVLDELCELHEGDCATMAQLTALCAALTQALEEAAGERPRGERSRRLTTDRLPKLPEGKPVYSFSGGVAALLDHADTLAPLAYGDIGVLLARQLRTSRLMAGEYRICPDAIRATVIGAGCHATSVSGSTIYYRDVSFPLRGLPVVELHEEELQADPERVAKVISDRVGLENEPDESPVVLALEFREPPRFAELSRLAEGIARAHRPGLPIITVSQADCAKALGQALACRLPPPQGIACLDSLHLQSGSYLDIGAPVADGSALPVVIKTLIFSS